MDGGVSGDAMVAVSIEVEVSPTTVQDLLISAGGVLILLVQYSTLHKLPSRLVARHYGVWRIELKREWWGLAMINRSGWSDQAEFRSPRQLQVG